MQRLILAAIVAFLLLPEEYAPEIGLTLQKSEPVSTMDTIGAARDVIDDIATFCDRNEEACETGKSIVTSARNVAVEGLKRANAVDGAIKDDVPNSQAQSAQ